MSIGISDLPCPNSESNRSPTQGLHTGKENKDQRHRSQKWNVTQAHLVIAGESDVVAQTLGD